MIYSLSESEPGKRGVVRELSGGDGQRVFAGRRPRRAESVPLLTRSDLQPEPVFEHVVCERRKPPLSQH